MFYLSIPYHGIESRLAETYEDLTDAKSAAEEKSVYGYCVTDEADELIYSPVGSFVASHILWHAKDVADYMRLHGYTYGDADRNPALDKNSETPEKLVSCDRFCGWVLYEAGYIAHQPQTKGLPLYFSPNLEEFLVKYGFTRIEDAAEVRPGDLIFEGESHHMAPALPEKYRDYPRHVFINAGHAHGDLFYRYDSGSDQRIQSIQPMIERLSKPEQGRHFRFAYRAPALEDVTHINAHVLSTRNRDLLKKSRLCGCFYCKSIYDPQEIDRWADGGETAFCPRCGMDSVLPETKEYPLSSEFLQKMHDYWF